MPLNISNKHYLIKSCTEGLRTHSLCLRYLICDRTNHVQNYRFRQLLISTLGLLQNEGQGHGLNKKILTARHLGHLTIYKISHSTTEKNHCFFCQLDDGQQLFAVRTHDARKPLKKAVEISQNQCS